MSRLFSSRIALACLALFATTNSLAADPVPKTVRVAAVQFISQWAKPAENRKALEPLVREAAGHGAKIVVLPEAAISGYMSHDIGTTWQVDQRPLSVGLEGISPKAVAESVPGESTKLFGALAEELPNIAKKTNVNIIGANWSVPAKPDWHGYGQSLILRRNGQVAARVKNDLVNEIVYADLEVVKKP